MAQAISNTTKNTYRGLFSTTPKSYGGLLSASPKPTTPLTANSSAGLFGGGTATTTPAPSGSYTATPLFPSASPKQAATPTAASPSQTPTPQYSATAPVNNQTGVNPNAGQYGTGGISAPTPQPVRGLFSDVATSLSNFNAKNNPQVDTAYANYDKAVGNLQKFNQDLGQKITDQEGRGIPIEFVQGRQQAINRQGAITQASLQDAVNQQQTAINQGLTASGQQLSGLTSLAGLAPEATRYEAFGGSGGNLSPQTRAAELAGQVRQGLISPEKAEAQMNSLYGGAGATFLNQALQGGGGYNYNVGSANASAQATNTQTQGTANTNIAYQGLNDATKSYVEMSGQAQNATTQASRVKDILAKTGLNNASSTDYNRAVNELSNRFSNPDFTALQSALLEARSFYSALLAMRGGTPTGNESQALNSLDITKSAGAINASIRELDNAVSTMLQTQAGIRDTYQQNLGGGSNGGTPTNQNAQSNPPGWF